MPSAAARPARSGVRAWLLAEWDAAGPANNYYIVRADHTGVEPEKKNSRQGEVADAWRQVASLADTCSRR
jgi:hypothetical protein